MKQRKITKHRFLDFLKVQESGKCNMIGYDLLIQEDGVYETCYKHFIDDEKDEDCLVGS